MGTIMYNRISKRSISIQFTLSNNRAVVFGSGQSIPCWAAIFKKNWRVSSVSNVSGRGSLVFSLAAKSS